METEKNDASLITAAIRNDGEYRGLRETLERQMRGKPLPVVATGLCDGAAFALAAAICKDLPDVRPVLLLCRDEAECDRWSAALSALGLSSPVFRTRDLNYNNYTPSRDFERERIRLLCDLTAPDCAPDFLITTPDAALGRTIPPGVLSGKRFVIRQGAEISPRELILRLTAAAFSRCELADAPGRFSSRGGIVDFCVCSAPDPDAVPDSDAARGITAVRVEFFGDEIDRICRFDTVTQRTAEYLDSVEIIPQKEVIPAQGYLEKIAGAIKSILPKSSGSVRTELESELASISAGTSDLNFADKYVSLIYPESSCLLDYFESSRLVILRDGKAVRERVKSSAAFLETEAARMIESFEVPGKYASYSLPPDRMRDYLGSRVTLCADSLPGFGTGMTLGGLFGFMTKRAVSAVSNEQLLTEDLESYSRAGYRIILTASGAEEASRYERELSEKGFICRASAEPDGSDLPFSLIPAGGIVVLPASPVQPFELPLSRTVLISLAPAASRRRGQKREQTPASVRKRILSFSELRPGDYVVHETHGIGQYLGIASMTVGGVTKDYIRIQYAGSDRLFLPADRLERISKYIGSHADDGNVKLSKFGSAEWGKTKSRTKSALRDIAKELIALYAERQRRQGFAFSADDAFQIEFEDGFEYEETDAQRGASDEIKADMMRPVPMDRLLCGDVGYGKTEVALRAAFKAILDRKQVAFLVPTTILALQHYQTAAARMRDFPVNVEMLSRFRSPKEQKKILASLAKGDVDLIIGTHRILSNDVVFKDLGLLIVDEEQRFGVAQKEKIKQRSRNVDVLSLSATPIPRTMNMAMTGIRDVSVLDEAPGSRLPVQTYVLEHSDAVVQEAIRKELRRGGQVFYLCNVIDSLGHIAAGLSEAFPEANVVFAHGQMDKERLEDIWRDMTTGDIDVLVCTTIIEAGVDVPNANTLIVKNAHRMGLSQLHQLRGRVGRSPRRAYAYFTYPPDAALSEIAERRLEAIREFTEFGAGFRIALRDLELRGAGNLLGAEQSGRIDAVGYDLYVKLLNEAVLEEKGELPPPPPECTVSINEDAFLPESFISSSAQRMAIYKRMANIGSEEDARDVADEMIDRYGDIPGPAATLLDVALIRAAGAKAGISSIRQDGRAVRIAQDPLDVETWHKVASGNGKMRLAVSRPHSVILSLREGERATPAILALLKKYAANRQNVEQ
ncbi:MAG: transcription-repair coupling factor [Clostridia bacterium]|nr:transcription-repair coupling factor [Clostridia bacterium]